MNPESRTMLQVTIDDAMQADETFDMLMGNEVAPRRKRFIQTHAKHAQSGRVAGAARAGVHDGVGASPRRRAFTLVPAPRFRARFGAKRLDPTGRGASEPLPVCGIHPLGNASQRAGDHAMPLHKANGADLAGGSPVLPVAEVVAIVREWVDLHARRLPDFAGAYLWGGITALPPDAPFPLYRDVDVVVVLTQGAQEDEQEVLYRGLMLEVISEEPRRPPGCGSRAGQPQPWPEPGHDADPGRPDRDPRPPAPGGRRGLWPAPLDPGPLRRRKRRRRRNGWPPCARPPPLPIAWMPCGSFWARSAACWPSRNSSVRPPGARSPCCANYSTRKGGRTCTRRRSPSWDPHT